jgi:hypothetical protein
MAAAGSDRTRLKFDISGQRARDLEALMQEAGLATKREAFNVALSLLTWVVREVGKGKFIASVDEKTGRIHQLAWPLPATADADMGTRLKHDQHREKSRSAV